MPTGGRPLLLAESVKELQEEMRCYLSFSDKEVFKDMVLPEEMSAIPTEEANTQSAGATLSGTPEEEATIGTAREPTVEEAPQISSLVGRRCYIHPDPWWLLGRSPIC